MSVRTALLSAAHARFMEKIAMYPDQIKISLREREKAEQRLEGHLLLKLPEKDLNEIKRAIKEMNIHIETLPVVREKYRRGFQHYKREIQEWYNEKERELNGSNMV